MKTKTIISLFFICSFFLFISCNGTKSSDGKVFLSMNEQVKMNAIKYYDFVGMEDSLRDVTVEISLIDSFTLKENIDFRKKQLIDSINNTSSKSQINYLKETILLLDSIEKSSSGNLNDIVSYYYEITKQYGKNENILEKSVLSLSTIYFYTDATPKREIINLTEEEKKIIQNPFENPDYLSKIDRLTAKKDK